MKLTFFFFSFGRTRRPILLFEKGDLAIFVASFYRVFLFLLPAPPTHPPPISPLWADVHGPPAIQHPHDDDHGEVHFEHGDVQHGTGEQTARWQFRWMDDKKVLT